MSYKLFICFALAALFVMTASCLPACSDYVHLWRPVAETRSQAFAPEGIALFVDHVIASLHTKRKSFRLSVNPASEINEDLRDAIKQSAAMIKNSQVCWFEEGSPFDSKTASATIWLDFVNPDRMVYLWSDQNKPPFAMFRTGELDNARVRVLIKDEDSKVELIDEYPFMFLLESDFMLPGWLSSGGVWFRRLSFKTAQMTHRHEWTMSVPSDIEDINQTPSDIRRFFFGEVPSDSIHIYSNY